MLQMKITLIKTTSVTAHGRSSHGAPKTHQSKWSKKESLLHQQHSSAITNTVINSGGSICIGTKEKGLSEQSCCGGNIV